MSSVKVVLNSAGVRELLKSKEIQQACRDQGSRVLESAGSGYVMEDRNYPERSGVSVRTDSYEAYFSNIKNNTLLKALR